MQCSYHLPLNEERTLSRLSMYDKCGNLGGWAVEMSELHRRWKAGTEHLSPEMADKMTQLSSMGFGFDVFPSRPGERTWDDSYQLLLEYKRQYNTTRVPHHYKADYRLGSWVAVQRTQYKYYNEGKPTRITDEQIQRLDDIGFEWVARQG